MTDYCATCAEHKSMLDSLKESLSKYNSQSEVDVERIVQVKTNINMIETVLSKHRKEVQLLDHNIRPPFILDIIKIKLRNAKVNIRNSEIYGRLVNWKNSVTVQNTSNSSYLSISRW